MSRKEIVTFTNMCMITDGNGNVLVQNRIDPSWPGIAFPGGHVEIGESFVDAVTREVFEETGLTVSNLTLCGIKNWAGEDGTRYFVTCYKTSTFSGEMKSSDEGEVFWTPLCRLRELNLCDNMQNMLNLFLDDSISEHYFYQENGEWIEVLK
jgi:8-oxo-dGTP diphosphatase